MHTSQCKIENEWYTQNRKIDAHKITWFYWNLTWSHHKMLSHNSWLFRGPWKPNWWNIKSLCCHFMILETKIAIMIITNRYHDCEEDITMLDLINNCTALVRMHDNLTIYHCAKLVCCFYLTVLNLNCDSEYVCIDLIWLQNKVLDNDVSNEDCDLRK